MPLLEMVERSLSELRRFGVSCPRIARLNMQHNALPSTFPACTPQPTILRLYWSITTRTQWVRNIADSHRNRSMLQRLSFACPRNVNHDGPRATRDLVDSVKRECGGQRPCRFQRRRLDRSAVRFADNPKSYCAASSRRWRRKVPSMDLFGPVRHRFGENNNRYFRFRRIQWKSRSVEGQITMAVRINRDGRINRAQIPETARSEALRFGERFRDRLMIVSWCLTKSDSATTERRPPGPRSRVSIETR